MLKKNFSQKIIEESICKMQAKEIVYDRFKVNDACTNDDRELLLDDVTEVLNEIYQVLIKDYKSRFKKP